MGTLTTARSALHWDAQPREGPSMTTDELNTDAEEQRTSLIIVSDFI